MQSIEINRNAGNQFFTGLMCSAEGNNFYNEAQSIPHPTGSGLFQGLGVFSLCATTASRLVIRKYKGRLEI